MNLSASVSNEPARSRAVPAGRGKVAAAINCRCPRSNTNVRQVLYFSLLTNASEWARVAADLRVADS